MTVEKSDVSLIKLLGSMTSRVASDLFLCEGKRPAMRVHGVVRLLKVAPTSKEELEELMETLMAPSVREQFDATGDVDFGCSLEEGQRVRVNLSRQKGVLALVARAVASGAMEIDELGLPAEVGALVESSRGLLLVTGATGSGKSTTLSALVHQINKKRAAHIVTIEEPIEFVHEDLRGRVSQREVGTDTVSFSEALRHVVRQSPDVIVVGEMRDAETMAVAISAALTGHLVLATMHTIDATQTLQRMLGYFPSHLRGQVGLDLSLCLRGIVSQRLMPHKSGDGRVVAVEVLTNGPAVSKLLRDQRLEELVDLMRGSNDPGLTTFNESLLDLFRNGEVSFEAGHAYATNPDEFALQAKGMATGLATFRAELGRGEDAALDMKSLLGVVLERGASDLHLTVGRPPILRVSGNLVQLTKHPLTDSDMRTLLFSILSGRQRSVYELDREIDFALALENGRRFRVNAYFQKGRMAAALRAIQSSIPEAEELGIPEEILEMGRRPQGLLLVVGPTGAGKSTTLACLVDRINRTRACRIITIEDPIEYVHKSNKATIDQREVFADTRSFGDALKYILRQDPDVIMVGEMRDIETISSALTAAETGHLVLATLHSNDSVQTIDRIVDVFPPHQQSQARSQLAGSLLGVVSQRLLPQKEGDGRVAAFEIMKATAAIRNLIRENKMHQAHGLLEASRRDGNVTMDHALKELVKEGKITLEDAMRCARNPRVFSDKVMGEAKPGGSSGWFSGRS